jgi:CRP-like cAMP-binding protein
MNHHTDFSWPDAPPMRAAHDDHIGHLPGCGPVFEFLGCWFDLYKNMSSEELTVFNSILQSRVYEAGEPLLSQGLPNDRLYFINRGQAGIVWTRNGGRMQGASLGTGQIVGTDTFFRGGLSRHSVLADQGMAVDYLEKDDVLDTFGCVPGLLDKLKSFCLKREREMQAIYMDATEKRRQRRYAVSGLTAAKLLDEEGLPMGKPFRGELLDISEGGFSFSLRLAEEDMACRLTGRSIVSLIKVQPSRPGDDVFWGGRIVQVIKRHGAHYSVHLKGDTASSRLTTMIRSLAD